MTVRLQPYPEYQKVTYDYVLELSKDWHLLPNIAVFQERIDQAYLDKLDRKISEEFW